MITTEWDELVEDCMIDEQEHIIDTITILYGKKSLRRIVRLIVLDMIRGQQGCKRIAIEILSHTSPYHEFEVWS